MIPSKFSNTKNFLKDALLKAQITTQRTELLHEIAKKIAEEYIERGKINLNFICTHNSRRSQMAQVWSFFATEYFELENIFSYSGGTTVTAFHRNTIKTLQKSGFSFNVIDFSHQNPKYLITFENTRKSILGYSKLYDDANNQYSYIAITTCEKADENCPYIADAIGRFYLPYEDPQITNSTIEKEKYYLKINQQIAGEIYILFKEIKRLITENN